MSEKPSFVRGRLSPRGITRLRWLFGTIYRTLARVEVSGAEHLPADGGCLVVTNHLSRFDGPLIFITMPNSRLALLNADNYRRNPVFRWVLESVDVIWVRRGSTTPSTIKAALRALKEGFVLGIAPEGTRSPTHALQAGKTGAAYLAVAAGAVVVPVAITGTENMRASLMRLRRARLTVRYGPPFRLAESGSRVRLDTEGLEQATTEVMCRIAALLPERYRGAYAGHARVRELEADLRQAASVVHEPELMPADKRDAALT
jgi:1-acyl-sn-glycerol-3-phosphate acyltransferase